MGQRVLRMLHWFAFAACCMVLLVSLVMWPRSYFYEDGTWIEVSKEAYVNAGPLSDGGVLMIVVPLDGPPWPNSRVPWEERKFRSVQRPTQDSYPNFLPWWRAFNPGASGSYVVIPYYFIALGAAWAASLAFLPPLYFLRPFKRFRVRTASLLYLTTTVAIIVACQVHLGNGFAVIAFECCLLVSILIVAQRNGRRSKEPA